MSPRRPARLAALATLVALGGVATGARADIAPSRQALGLVPLQPVEHAPEVVRVMTTHREAPVLPDAAVDVSLAEQRTVVDLYPTFLLVRSTATLRGGAAGARELPVGIPERAMGAFESSLLGLLSKAPEPAWQTKQVRGFPIEDLVVRVNGERIEIPHLSPAGDWWRWPVTVPPGGEARLELSYTVGLYHQDPPNDRGLVISTVNLPRLSSLWRGKVGRLELVVRPHGIDVAAVNASIEPPARTADALRWTYADTDPTTDFYFWFELSNEQIEQAARGDAPYSLAEAPPRLALVDRLVRLERHLKGKEPPESYDEGLDEHGNDLHRALHGALDTEDPDAREYAAEVLARLAPRCAEGSGPVIESIEARLTEPGPASRFERGLGAFLRPEYDRPTAGSLLREACVRAYERGRRIRIGVGSALAAAVVTFVIVTLRRRRARRRRAS